MYPEGSDYLVGYIREHKLGEYLNLIKESKKVCEMCIRDRYKQYILYRGIIFYLSFNKFWNNSVHSPSIRVNINIRHMQYIHFY